MILVVNNSGAVIPAATIVWGPGVEIEHRGNNVWHVSNLKPASEYSAITHTVTATSDVTYTKTHSRTGIRTEWKTRTNTRSPIVDHPVTATRTVTKWVTEATVWVGTRTEWHTIYDNTKTRTVTKTVSVCITRSAVDGTEEGTRTVTQWFTLTRSPENTVEVTKTRTVTVTKEVTPAFVCCDECITVSDAGGAGTYLITCDECGDPPCDGTVGCDYAIEPGDFKIGPPTILECLGSNCAATGGIIRQVYLRTAENCP